MATNTVLAILLLSPVVENFTCKTNFGEADGDDNRISLTLDESANLYGLQSSVNRIPLNLSNDNNVEMTFTLSFQERFPTDNFDPKKPHVELVESVDPTEIMLSPNTSSEIFVNITVPHYVPPHLRSKVTVIATPLASDSLSVAKEEISFYFIVLGKEDSLEDIDGTPPHCILTDNCWQESCHSASEETCDDYYWDSVFSVSDDISGLLLSNILHPSEAAVIQSWSVGGSVSQESLTVRTSCCQPSLALSLTDLAGNTNTCTAGPLRSTGSSTPATQMFVLVTTLLISCKAF